MQCPGAGLKEYSVDGELANLAPCHDAAPNRALGLRLSGYVDEQILKESIEILCTRHPEFQWSFNQDHNHRPLTYARVDLSSLDDDVREEELTLCWKSEVSRPFDCDFQRTVRLTMYKLGTWDHMLLMVLHPAIAPPGGVAMILDDLASLYEARVLGMEDPQQTELLTWQSSETKQGLSEIRTSGVPYDKAPVHTYALTSDFVEIELENGVKTQVEDMAQTLGVSCSQIYLASWAIVLSRYHGENDATLGVTGRGMGGATYPGYRLLSLDFSDQASFLEVVNGLPDTLLRAPSIASEAMVGMDAAYFLRSGKVVYSLPRLLMRRQQRDYLPTPLCMVEDEDQACPGLRICFDAQLYTRGTITRLVSHYLVLLKAALTFPDQAAQHLPMLTADERSLLRSLHKEQVPAYTKPTQVQHIFERQVRLTPDDLALVDEGGSLTYRELDEHANQLAHHLQSLNIRCGDLIGLANLNGNGLVIAALAGLKVGAVLASVDHFPKNLARQQYPKHILCWKDCKRSWGKGLLRATCVRMATLDVSAYPKTRPSYEGEADGLYLKFMEHGEQLLVHHQSTLQLLWRQSLLSGMGRHEEHIVYIQDLGQESWLRDLFAHWRSGGKVLLADRRNHTASEEPFLGFMSLGNPDFSGF